MKANEDSIKKSIKEATDGAIKSIISQTIDYANETMGAAIDKLTNEAMEKIQSSLEPVILKVNINDTKDVKLSSTAVPYLDRMIINAKLKLNTMLVGPAGCGKSFAAAQLAEALDLPYGHINLTAGASESWLFGRQTPNGFVDGVFYRMYKNGGVFLLDEIDAADPNLLLAVNTAIANDSLYNPMNGELVNKHDNFVLVAAANTYGKGGDHVYTGRNRLDASTLDRFVQIVVDYNTALEKRLCPEASIHEVLHKVRAMLIDARSDEIISTRAFISAHKQHSAGVAPVDIFSSISASWPEEYKDFFEKAGVQKPTKKRGK